MKYSVKIVYTDLFPFNLILNRTIRNAKAHVFTPDIPLLQVFREDETREFFNILKVKRYVFSKEWYAMEAKKAEQESNGIARPEAKV